MRSYSLTCAGCPTYRSPSEKLNVHDGRIFRVVEIEKCE